MRSIYQQRARTKANYLGNRLPKFFFVLFAVAGAASIWALKSISPGNGGIAALVAVLFIVSYCALSYNKRLLTIREDVIGDNAYYLGFLFTLTSLSHALYSFVSTGSDPNSIIESFGIALVSTIAGIIARVFFSQLRQDPDDIEKDARTRISETASALSAELGNATVSFNDYRRSLEQSISEAFLEHKARFDTTLSNSLEKFTSTSDVISSSISKMHEEAIAQATKLGEISSKSVVALEDLNKRISGIEAPDTLINKKFEILFQNLESASAKLISVADAQSASTIGMIGSAKAMQENIAVINTQIETFQRQASITQSSAELIGNVSTKLDTMPESLARFMSGLTTLIEQQSQAIKAITEHANALEVQLHRSRSYTEETHSALSSMTRTLADKLS